MVGDVDDLIGALRVFFQEGRQTADVVEEPRVVAASNDLRRKVRVRDGHAAQTAGVVTDVDVNGSGGPAASDERGDETHGERQPHAGHSRPPVRSR